MAVARLPEMSGRAAPAAQTGRKAEATTAGPNPSIDGTGDRWMPPSRSTKAGAATAAAREILNHVGIPFSLFGRDAAWRASPGQGAPGPKVSFAPHCGVGDRAEAGMSITPTPLVRRELLPFCRNELLVDLWAVNLLRDRTRPFY